MKTILSQANTSGGATLEILVMLFGAALIGYFTAFYYYRKKYQSVSDDANDLQQKLNELEKENNKQNSENHNLKKKYLAMEGLYHQSLKQIDDLSARQKSVSHQLSEKDDVLLRIAERKKLLNFESFGKATANEKDDLQKISGIGPFIESKLHALDIYTFEQISRFSTEDIKTINDAIEFFPGRIERDEWVAQAKELIYTMGEESALLARLRSRKHLINYSHIGIAHPDESDDLTQINGIGKWIEQKLNALDIYTFRQIATFTEEDKKTIDQVIEFFPGRINRDQWVSQAKGLAQQSKQKKDKVLKS